MSPRLWAGVLVTVGLVGVREMCAGLGATPTPTPVVLVRRALGRFGVG